MIFFFEFVYIEDYVNGFSYTEPILNPWDEASLLDCGCHRPPQPGMGVPGMWVVKAGG